MFSDYVMNGQAVGEVGEGMAGIRYDAGMLRPYIDKKGRKCVKVNVGRTRFDKKLGRIVPHPKKFTVTDAIHHGFPIDPSFVGNATSLRKDEWIQFDTVVVKAARQRLRAWSDLAASASFGGFDGMAKMTLEYEEMSDPGVALIDMDGITEAQTDEPQMQLQALPLPIIHSDFFFSQRQIASSRNTGTPVDTTMAEVAGRRIAETLEQLTIGTLTAGITSTTRSPSQYGISPQIYGYTNHPNRLTKTDLTVPDGTNPTVVLGEVLEMINTLTAQRFYGPFMLYHSIEWDEFMDNDYVVAAPQNTLRNRLRQIEAISDVRRLDFLTDAVFTLVLVQMTSDVARAVIGMDFTTVQWPTRGGMQQNFKVMTIQVPQVRKDFNNRIGVMHGTTA